MQSLLIRCGYRICGFVDELDPGDPDLVFFKTVEVSSPDQVASAAISALQEMHLDNAGEAVSSRELA
jgi:hypothetical protein